MTFGERLSEVRKDHRQTQKQLADVLNVSVHTISSYEQDRSVPSIPILRRICNIYNVSSDYLLCITDDDPLYDTKRSLQRLTNDEREKLREYEQFLIYQRKHNVAKKAAKD